MILCRHYVVQVGRHHVVWVGRHDVVWVRGVHVLRRVNRDRGGTVVHTTYKNKHGMITNKKITWLHQHTPHTGTDHPIICRHTCTHAWSTSHIHDHNISWSHIHNTQYMITTYHDHIHNTWSQYIHNTWSQHHQHVRYQDHGGRQDLPHARWGRYVRS